jgi:hypothetical protein
MDQVELEGRLSWLNKTDASASVTSLDNLSADQTKYIKLDGKVLEEDFNIKGGTVNASSTDVAEQTAYFRTFTSRVKSTLATSTGDFSDFTVRVEFQDQVDQQNNPVTRFVVMTRRIVHG